MKKLKVKELSRLAGIAPQTLRRYEELGIFRAQRDEQNRYRLYDAANLVQVLRIRSMKNCGLNEAEICQLYEADAGGAILKYGQYIQDLDREIAALRCRKQQLQGQRRRLEDWQALQSVPFELRRRPECQVFLYREGHEGLLEEAEGKLPFVVEHMGPMRSCTIRLQADFERGDTRYYGGVYAFTEELAESWEKGGVQCMTLPECTCMVMAGNGVGSMRDKENNKNLVRALKERITEHGFTLSGDILGEVLHVKRKQEQVLDYNVNMDYYSLIWVPVEPLE